MAHLIDYLEKVENLTFDQEPLNILDKVCINEIGYLTYEKWLTASDLKKPINLHDFAEGKELNPDYSFMVRILPSIQLFKVRLPYVRKSQSSCSWIHQA